jgi:hypothetical protein
MTPLRWLHAMFLRYVIWETEHWLRDCANDGLRDGTNLRLVRAQLEADRVSLALLQAPTARLNRRTA